MSTIVVRKHRSQVMKDLEIAKTGSNITNQFNKNKSCYTHLFDSDPEYVRFAQGTYQDVLLAKYDTCLFASELERINKSGILDKIQYAISSSVRRKRVMDEHDGEWDMDRRWDHEPFSVVRKMPDRRKSVEFIWHTQFPANVRGRDITRCGAIVYAITRLIESSGISVSVNFKKQVTSINVAGELDFDLNIEIKGYNDYLSESELASSFTSNFYRRAMFCQTILASDSQGKEVADNLGYPVKLDNGLFYSDGKLEIKGYALTDYDVEVLLDKIIEDLGLTA